MAKSVHNNWYQSRSIRGGRRYAGDRDIQNLYSDGVLESKTSSIRGPYSAETRQDLQNDFNRVISLMEGLITRINNNIAHQEQMAKQSQEKYLESKKKSDARWEALLKKISKKDPKAPHNEKEAVDLDYCVEVVEQEAAYTDSAEKEFDEMEKAEKDEDLTKPCDEIGKTVPAEVLGSKEKNNEQEVECEVSPEMAVVEGEIVEPTVGAIISTHVNLEEALPVRKSKYDFKSGARLAGKPNEDVYFGVNKGGRQWQRSNTLPAVFPRGLIFTGGHRGVEWSARVRRWWLRKRRNQWGKNPTSRDGDGERKSGGKNKWMECSTVIDGKFGRCPVEVGGGMSRPIFTWVGKVEQLRAITGEYFQLCNRIPNTTFEGCWKNLESGVRGIRVIRFIHYIVAEVINSILSPIFIFDPMPCYTQLPIYSTFLQSIVWAPTIIFPP